MTIRIQYTNDARSFNGVKCAVYGRAGVGKTRLARTAPRPIILSAEQGLLSLRKERVPYIQIDSFKALEEAHAWATKSSEARNFDTVGLDSVSEIAEVVLAEEKGRTRDPRKAYGELSTSMIGLLRDFRDLPQKHVYFIAKEETYESAPGMKTARPSFPGQQLAMHMPYFFDEVFQLLSWVDQATGQPVSALKTQTDISSEGKDRSGALNLYEPADLTYIFQKIIAG